MRTKIVGALVALLGSAAALAQSSETLYVVEQLTVSVNATADGSGERVGQIKSGDKVEALERSGDQTHVKLASGEEGWVRTSYLSANRPLREQLKASTDELDKLRQEKSKLEADLAAAKKAASAAPAPSAPAAASPSAAPAPEAHNEAASPDPLPSNPPIFADTGVMPSRPSWLFALIASVVTLVVGFALGWRVLDRRIRAKYGGLRIY